MAKIESVRDLPEWFDLEKYKGCESFGAAEWHANLKNRRALLIDHPDFMTESAIDFWCVDVAESMVIWRNKAATELVEQISRLRINPVTTDKPTWLAGGYFQPVRPLTAWALNMAASLDHQLAEEDPTEETLSAAQRWQVIGGADKPWIDDMQDCEIDVFDSPALIVNLRMSDAAIRASFDAWLNQARSATGDSNFKPAKPFYDRWARYGLLPYLDLRIWELEMDNHIPDRVMSAAISRYDKGEANLRKTIAPLAKSIISNGEELQAMAAMEMNELRVSSPETFQG